MFAIVFVVVATYRYILCLELLDCWAWDTFASGWSNVCIPARSQGINWRQLE